MHNQIVILLIMIVSLFCLFVLGVTLIAKAISYYYKNCRKNVEMVKKLAESRALTFSALKKEYRKALKPIEKHCWECGCRLKIFVNYFEAPNFLNGNATIYRVIFVSPAWIPKLLSGDKKWECAFVHEVGHELGHKMHEPICGLFDIPKHRFRNWVRECRADFYGITFAQKVYPDISREKINDIIRMKRIEKHPDLEEGMSVGCKTHPSPVFRQRMIDEYSGFGEEVVREIAKEAGVTDEKYIRRMIR